MSPKPRNTKPAVPQATQRAEKLSALASMLGQNAMDRLQRDDKGFAPGDEALSKTNQDRVTWQRNRLLERLRAHLPDPDKTPDPHGIADASAPIDKASAAPASVDTRIAAAVDLSTLADEHPAVIRRVLDKLSREERVKILKALPGPIARAAIRGLRSSD